jgi:serine/threonine-protein kinase
MPNDSPSPKPSANRDDLTSLGKYSIQKKIGAGGMGTVYLAVDQQLKRTVALKVLPKDKADNKTLVRRFKAEGQAGAQLEHPNIVSVYESGEIDGYLYLAMEYIEGLDAYELLKKRGVLPAKRSLEIIKQVVQALDHAYQRSVVHRDIKPSNLLIRDRDGLVKLADMGLARVIEDDNESGITKAGTTVGTVDYMAPEQARDSKLADSRSDIYSLGCTWYHLLAGKAPFPDGDLMNKLRAHAMQPVPDPRDWNDNIPAGIVAVIQRMMAKKADDRYQTPKELLADLNSPALLRSNFSADQLSLLASSHAGGSAVDDDDPEADDSSPVPSKSKKSKSPAPVSKSGSQARPHVEREEPEPEDDSPATPSKFKKSKPTPESASGKRLATRDTLPPRGSADTAPEPSGSGKKAKSERVLPGRIDQPLLSEAPSTSLDPNTLKLGLLVLIVVVTVGGLVYGLIKYSQGDSGGAGIANPYAKPGVEAAPTVAPNIVQGNPAAPNAPNAPPTTPGAPHVVAPSVTVTNAAPPAGNAPQTVGTPFGGVVVNGQNSLPGWIAQSRLVPPNLPPQVVRAGDPADGEFTGISQALGTIKGDAIIQLAEVGPHEIPALEKKSAGTWLIRGAEGVMPILVLRSGTLRLQQGSLILEGVHLVLLSDHTGPGLVVGPGILTVRNSTVTHLSPSAAGLIVAESGGKVLIEDSLIRTQGTCSPLTLRGQSTGLALGNSLVIAGNSRAIQLQSKDAVGDSRQVTLVRSAVFSGQAGLCCSHEGKQPPALDLQLRQSLLGYLPGHSADAIGVEFQGWPKAAEALDRPRVSGVTWVSEKSAFVGWPHWAMLGFADKSAPLDIRDDEAWRGFWRSPTSPGELIPEGANLQSAASAAALATVDQVQSGLVGVAPQINDIGPQWTGLPKPPQSIFANIIAFDQKTQLPPGLAAPDPGQTLRFDLKKPTLGRYLTSEEVPDGSTVIAFGSGLRTLDPFVLKQKRVQLVFEQTEGVPLVIQPAYKTEPGATKPAAWIGVEDGQLTIENGFFRMLAGNRNYPDRFLQMSGGLAVLRTTKVEGVDSAFPLIDLLPSAGHAPPQLLIDRSLLAGFRSVLRHGAAESVLELRQSILSSSTGVAMTWDLGSEGSTTFVNNSTLVGTKSVFQVLPLGANSPIELFSEGAVYSGGSMLDLGTAASAVQWWGRRNGYSGEMKTFLLSGGNVGPQDFQSTWVQGWGAGHELNPVSGTNAVLLPSQPAVPVDTIPESFTLHDDCAASKAGLGAPTSQVGPQRIAAKPATTKPATPTVKPNTPVKSPGF